MASWNASTQTVQPERSRYSISKLADMFAADRRTISLLMESVQPAGTEKGHAVYAMRDAAIPIVEWIKGQRVATKTIADEKIDPDKLAPRDYRDYWQGEEARLRAQARAQGLIPQEEVEQEMRALIEPTIRFLETLPDILERDAGLSPEQIEQVQRVVDTQRALLAEEMEA